MLGLTVWRLLWCCRFRLVLAWFFGRYRGIFASTLLGLAPGLIWFTGAPARDTGGRRLRVYWIGLLRLLPLSRRLLLL